MTAGLVVGLEYIVGLVEGLVVGKVEFLVVVLLMVEERF